MAVGNGFLVYYRPRPAGPEPSRLTRALAKAGVSNRPIPELEGWLQDLENGVWPPRWSPPSGQSKEQAEWDDTYGRKPTIGETIQKEVQQEAFERYQRALDAYSKALGRELPKHPEFFLPATAASPRPHYDRERLPPSSDRRRIQSDYSRGVAGWREQAAARALGAASLAARRGFIGKLLQLLRLLLMLFGRNDQIAGLYYDWSNWTFSCGGPGGTAILNSGPGCGINWPNVPANWQQLKWFRPLIDNNAHFDDRFRPMNPLNPTGFHIFDEVGSASNFAKQWPSDPVRYQPKIDYDERAREVERLTAGLNSPRRGKLELPDELPVWFDPFAAPVFGSDASERPAPYRMVPYRKDNPNYAPTERSTRRYFVPGRIDVAPVFPLVQPVVAAGSASGGQTTTVVSEEGNRDIRIARHSRPRPPRAKEKESKVVLSPNSRTGIFQLVNPATEFADFVDAIWSALPKEARTRKDSYMLKTGEGKRVAVVTKDLTPQRKLADIYRHVDKIDWQAAVWNVFANEVKDRAWATIGKGLGLAARRAGKATGFGTGTAL